MSDTSATHTATTAEFTLAGVLPDIADVFRGN